MKCFFLFIVFLFCAIVQTVAQKSDHYRLSVFGTRNGLLSPKIYTLLQSSDHRLWIGTEIGASRYNGYEFENIQYTAAQEQIGKIVAITEDSVGGIWLGGERGLFYYYNREVTPCVFVQNYIAAIESLTTDKDGTVWIGEIHGLYRLTAKDIQQWRLQRKRLQLQSFKGIKQRITCLDVDAKGNLYYGTYEGAYVVKSGSSKVDLFWKNNNPDNLVRFVTALSPDSVFFNKYNGESASSINGITKSYTAETNTGHRFFKKGNTVFRLTTSTVEKFEKGEFIPFINFGMQTNYAFDALLDAEGNIWVGTWEGLFKYRYNPFTVYERKGTQHPETFSMLETNEGRLLFGGNRGSINYKKESEIIPVKEIKPPFPMSEVLAMYQHTDGSYWFGSGYQGIACLRAGKYTTYNEAAGLPDNHCNTFYPVDDHTVFACSEKGVIVLDPLAENPVTEHYSFEKAYNRQPKLLGVFEPEKGVFLFYSNGGLFRLRQGKLGTEIINGMPAENLYISRIQQDRKGRVWIATLGKGLLQCRYDKKGLTVERHYTKKNGLLSEELLSLVVDRNDNIWVADYMSLSLLKEDGVSFTFINFTEDDGLPEAYYQHLHLTQQRNGIIWGLNSMNLFSFKTENVSLNTIAPKLFFDKIVAGKVEQTGIPALEKKVMLSHDDNSLSFLFTAISLSNPAKIVYAYRLLPADTTWIETTERKLYFNSLNPGNYVVEIKASNNTGVWSAPLRYSFQVKPPFWATWWFYSLLSFFILLAIFWAFRKRIKAVNDKAAIRQQLTELESKALRAQMNPHFIFNSLNAIQELIMTKNIEAAYNYLSKFSKLLRQVLNHSEEALIPLADEIIMLRLYLELESLRFRNSFRYEILVDAALDAESISMPPMLLQPFMENAVWHGLMLKEGEKKLTLAIRQKNNKLLCVIEDNGIGRKEAAAIKANRIGAQHFESKGLQLSKQRVALLQQSDKETTLEIEDLYDEGAAAGTRVCIWLPFINN